MAIKDYDRDWKDCQRRFNNLQLSKARDQKAEVGSNIDLAQYKQLKSDLKEIKQELKSQKDKIGELESKSLKLDAQIFKVKSDYQMAKANVDADKYTYSEENKNGKDVKGFGKKLESEIDHAEA